MKKTALAVMLMVLWLWCSTASAVCEGTSGTGSCNANNTLSGVIPTQNSDGTAFSDFASVEVVFSLTAGACAQTVGATVKNLGKMNVPATPLPNTVVSTKLGALGLPNGKVFVAMRVVDLANNRSACSTPELQFTNDNITPIPPTGVSVSSVSVGPCTATLCPVNWTPVPGAVRYQVARLASGWSAIAYTTGTTVTIQRIQGIAQYAVFAELSSGEALVSPMFYTSK